MKNYYKIIFILLVSLSVFIIGYELEIQGRGLVYNWDILRTLDLIQKNYLSDSRQVPSKDEYTKLVVQALDDPNSKYFTKTEYEKFVAPTAGKFWDVNFLEDQTVYIKIYEFGPSENFNLDLLQKTLENKQVKNVIVDLRGNLGGNLYTAVDLASWFLKKGSIITSEIDKFQDKVHKADGLGFLQDVGVVIVVDKETSSAAEMLAAALRDNNRAKIIGEKTYGKGTMQENFVLSSGGVVHLTVGKWLTPKGENLEGKGLVPDFSEENLSTDSKELKIQLEKVLNK